MDPCCIPNGRPARAGTQAGRRPRPGGRALSAAGALVLSAVLTACGGTGGAASASTARDSGSATSASAPSGSGTSQPTATVHGGVVTWSGFPQPGGTADAFDTADGMLLWWPTTPPGRPASGDLARVDPSSGALTVVVHLPRPPDDVVAASGWLWAVAAKGAGAAPTLWRLSPSSLAISRTLRLPASDTGSAALAAAAGQLWVADAGELLRVSPASATVADRVMLSRARYTTSDVTTDPGTGDLLVAVAGGEFPTLQRRDPSTGALLASATPQRSTIAARLAPPVDGRLWASMPTGMMGSVDAFDPATLQPLGPPCAGGSSPTCISGTNAIRARTVGPSVVVTQLGGGPTRNRCIDPVTAATRAELPVAPDQVVLAVGTGGMVVSGQPGTGPTSVSLLPLPAGCLR